MNDEYDENQMLMETRWTLKPLRLEQDRKGMNKRISATLQWKMEGLEHELHPMIWHDEMNNAMPSEELKELNEKNLEGRVERSC